MTRQGFDSTGGQAHNIPTYAAVVGGYVDGMLWSWTDADWARFPNAVQVRIVRQASFNEGNCLDVETGDATPSQAPAWCQMRRAAGVVPTVYCNESTWPSVRAAFASTGVAAPNYWVANYSTGAVMIPGAIAHQYSDVGGYDSSICADYWPGVDPQPDPPEEGTAVNGALQMGASSPTDGGRIVHWAYIGIGVAGGPTAGQKTVMHAYHDVTAGGATPTQDLGRPSAEYDPVDAWSSGGWSPEGGFWWDYGCLTEDGTIWCRESRSAGAIDPTWAPVLVGVAQVVAQGPAGPPGTLPASFGATITVNSSKDA